MQEEMILDAKKVCKDYKKFSLVDVDITLKKGQFLGLIGPNGAGKTTLLLSILKLISSKNQKDIVWKKSKRPYLYKNIGVQLQDNLYNLSWSVKDAINISTKFNADWEYINKILHNLEIENIEKKIKQFSKGQRQKIDVLIALSNKPEVLILDEVTSNLDPIAKQKVIQYLKFLNGQHELSVIITSHFLDEIEMLCDTFFFIKKGKKLFEKKKTEYRMHGAGFLTKEFTKLYKDDKTVIGEDGRADFEFK